MAENEDQTAIVERFGELRTEVQQLAGKASDLLGELSEHELVIKTLEPFDADRRAWRLVGDVLVERTVKDILPQVQSNANHIKEAVEKLQADLKNKKTELSEFQAKHRIRVQGEEPEPEEAPQASSSGAPQGILVSKR